ncbi:hypothetical protein LSAT2_017903 [Lamellibrachia satsuma]|nr:hypothetical protein LSAT2_017903 [Lamellibrachia satsuma]
MIKSSDDITEKYYLRISGTLHQQQIHGGLRGLKTLQGHGGGSYRHPMSAIHGNAYTTWSGKRIVTSDSREHLHNMEWEEDCDVRFKGTSTQHGVGIAPVELIRPTTQVEQQQQQQQQQGNQKERTTAAETAFSRFRAPPGYYTMTQKLFAMTALALLVCSVIVPEVTSTTWSQNMIICMEACTKASNECTAQCNTDGLGDDCINKRCVRGMRNCSEFCNYLYGAELMTLPEQDFVGCFVMAHHMTCQTKTPLSRDGGDPWEGAVQFLVGHVLYP